MEQIAYQLTGRHLKNLRKITKQNCDRAEYECVRQSFKEGPLTTSNQLLSPYTVALRLR
jgi:hypothetical protein